MSTENRGIAYGYFHSFEGEPTMLFVGQTRAFSAFADFPEDVATKAITMFRKKTKGLDFLTGLKKRFDTLVPEPVLSIALQGHDGRLAASYVDFVFLLIEEPRADNFQRLASKVIEIATRHKAIVVANAGGLIQLAAGPRIGDEENSTYRISLIDDLVQISGGYIRIVHGRARSHVGTVGTESRKTWGFFPIKVGEILRALLSASTSKPVDLGNQQ